MEMSHYEDFGNLVLDAVSGTRKKGISTGFEKLDRYTGGFRKSNLIAIASRPRAGKSAYALSLASNIAFGENPVPVGFFSFEFNRTAITERIIANKAKIDLVAIREHRSSSEERDRMMKVAEHLYNLAGNFIIRDTPGLSVEEFSMQIRNMVKENGVRVVFVDGIGMIGQENHSISQFDRSIDVCRTLKLLAEELAIAVVCVCPVRTSKNQDRPPVLADLREFGLIDEFADQVIFLDDNSWSFDPSDYTEKEDDDGIFSKHRRISVIVAKNRYGYGGIFHAKMDTSCFCFEEVEPIRF